MTETTAKIRAKGLNATGFTETLATKYADSDLGQRFLAVVELKTEFVGEDAEGNRRLELIITQVEPAQNKDMEEHLRRLSRSAFYERKLHNADQPLPIDGKDDLEPKVKDVLASGRHLEHDDEAEPEPETEEDDNPDEEPEDEHDDGGPRCSACADDADIADAEFYAAGTLWTCIDCGNAQPAEGMPYRRPLPELPDEAYDEDAADLKEAVEAEHPEIVTFDNPSPSDIANNRHVHKSDGTCVKNRDGVRCTPERHLAPVSDPFTPQAG